MAETMDREVKGRGGPIPVRVYKPAGTVGALPVLVYFHGGGWMTGSIAGSAREGRPMPNEAKAIIVSVHQRLATDNRFPPPEADGGEAFAWAVVNAEDVGRQRAETVWDRE